MREKGKKMDTNVQFYEKISELQSVQHDCEEKRIDLERQLNSYVKSDKRIAKLKAVRLQSYWNKICEDEKRSQWRNEQLLKDFERVEMHMAELHSRTERLRDMKKRYEEYVERVYPNWKEKIMHFQRLRKHQEEQERARDLQRMEERERAAEALARVPQPAGAAPSLHPAHYGYVPPSYDDQHRHPSAGTNGAAGTMQTVSSLQTATYGSAHISSTPHPGTQNAQPISVSHPGSKNSQARAASYAEAQNAQPATTSHPGAKIAYHPSPQANRNEPKHRHRPVYEEAAEEEAPVSAQKALLAPRAGASPRQKSSQSGATSERTPTTPTTQITQKQIQTFMEDADRGDKEYSFLSAPRSSPRSPRGSARNSRHSAHVAVDQDKTDDQDVSDFGSDEDLPLSVSDMAPKAHHSHGSPRAKAGEESPRGQTAKGPAKSPRASPKGGITQVQPMGSKQGLNKSLDSELGETEKSIYITPEITLDGLYNLLSTIEDDMTSGKALNLYQADAPAESVQKDIIANANKGSVLSYNPSASLSMVVLDQLPLLVYTTQAKCVLPDKLLRKPPLLVSENSVRSHVDVTVQSFWDKLYDHFVTLMKYKTLNPREIAHLFAPLLISEDSPYESKAQNLIQTLLENANPEDVQSPHSTDTFTTPRPEVTKENKYDKRVEEEENDEAFFGQDVPKVTEVMTSHLTQTAAYRQMLTSTQSTIKSHVSYVESDEDDDIEHLLGSRQKPQPAAGVSGVASPRDTTPPMSPRGEGAVSPESVLSAATLPPSSSISSPPKGARPASALGDTGKSGRSTISLGSTKKSKAFYQDSDTDEDIQVPAGDFDGDKDDFDFYD